MQYSQNSWENFVNNNDELDTYEHITRLSEVLESFVPKNKEQSDKLRESKTHLRDLKESIARTMSEIDYLKQTSKKD